MPLAAGAPIVSGKSTREHTTLGRYLFHKLVFHFQSRGAPDVAYTLDDGLTVFIMTTISPSEQSVASSLQYWLSLLKFIVQELQLHRDEPGLAEDELEERRRYDLIPRTTRFVFILMIFFCLGYGGQRT
jgi:hypothetical protein